MIKYILLFLSRFTQLWLLFALRIQCFFKLPSQLSVKFLASDNEPNEKLSLLARELKALRALEQ